ncbi:MBL fold metallo-hydrolase [Rubrobacter indicoceani]|uniref:MBL fold metallo-hydrolase n=1 Tax=Rubrobacter indicoceani TaxID=2051957 RepID=UPI0013C47AF0|nr:MBL fold metallo-hydrolase [Rubrobacter indicoceani]
MKIEFLGTGGAVSIPRPLCGCRVCVEAREKGIPYSRGGPSVFVHGPDVLIDTPEEARNLLNRSGVTNINACLYSHWHPDHVMGRRVFESLNWDFRNWPPRNRRTDVYLPGRVGRDFRERLGSWQHFEFLQRIGVVNVVEVPEGDRIEVNGTTITPFPLAESFVYGFLFEGGGKRALIVPDEVQGWRPPSWLGCLDLAVLPMGIAGEHPLTGERNMPVGHPVLKYEAGFSEVLDIAEKLAAERTVLTHVAEMNGLSHDDLEIVAGKLGAAGLDVEFAYDTMVVEV